MNIVQLQYFTLVYEKLNYSKASQLICISRQALQQTIRALERELNSQLFIVKDNSLIPTPMARFLYHESRDTLYDFATLENNIKVFTQSKIEYKPNRQGTITNIHDIMSLEAARECHRRNFDLRDTHVSGSCDELRTLISNNKLDMAYLYGSIRYSVGFSLETYESGRLLWLAVPSSHVLAKRSTVTIADLYNIPFFGMGSGYDIDKAIKERCLSEGFELREVQSSPNSSMLLERVALGAGVTYRLSPVFQHEEDSARIKCIPFEDESLKWDNYAIFSNEYSDSKN